MNILWGFFDKFEEIIQEFGEYLEGGGVVLLMGENYEIYLMFVKSKLNQSKK